MSSSSATWISCSHQLAPCFEDILRSGQFRASAWTESSASIESTIVVNAHAINAGRLPVCSLHGDFQFWEMPDEAATAAKILEFCTKNLPAQGFSPLFDVQVLSPMHRQACGVDNSKLPQEESLNPAAPSEAGIRQPHADLPPGR